MPGLEVVDDPRTHAYPTATAAAGRDEVFVGRLRRDPSHERAINLWVVSDNLLKGAATNAVQLAEQLHQRGLVRARAAA
jgi:aspartate-semialdehyde dehydrogenase